MLSQFWQERWGMQVAFQPCFSCDCKASAQSFILQHWDPEMLLADILSLTGLALDLRSKQMRYVPPVDLWICGFECD